MSKLPGIDWDSLDWPTLDRLRDRFLSARPGGESYWNSRSDLQNYDFTFAQRIGWKWDAILRELKQRGWTPPSTNYLDWGCGSGIAGRRVIREYGVGGVKSLTLFDRSALAMEFAAAKTTEEFPSLRVVPFPANARETARSIPCCTCNTELIRQGEATVEAGGSVPAGQFLLIISHVLNELDAAGGQALRRAIELADAVLWVEPGTYGDSRSLIAMREELRESFHVIAPCTHQSACGLTATENERHWCHHFAKPPSGIMGDSNWVRFAQRAGIDLRSLPYSFLVLERKGLRDPVPGLLPEGFSRIIGEPRIYKGYAKIFSCQSDGVRDVTLQKRDAPELFKRLKKGEAESIHDLRSEGRIPVGS
jgi:hypothetical protein